MKMIRGLIETLIFLKRKEDEMSEDSEYISNLVDELERKLKGTKPYDLVGHIFLFKSLEIILLQRGSFVLR